VQKCSVLCLKRLRARPDQVRLFSTTKWIVEIRRLPLRMLRPGFAARSLTSTLPNNSPAVITCGLDFSLATRTSKLRSSHPSASYYLPDGLLTTKVAVHDTTSHPSALYGSPLPQLDMSDPATLLPTHNVASRSDPLLRVQSSLFRLPGSSFHIFFHRAGHGSRRLSMGNGEICRMSRRGERHRRGH
jgi:hypothetical protein